MNDDCPKLRSDLIVTSETEGETVFYTVKEPLTGRFFRLRAPEYYLLSRADGETTAARAAELTEERFGVRIPAAAAEAFFTRMEHLLFFEGLGLERERPRLSRMTIVGQRRSLGTIRLKAFDPDALLARWTPRLRFLFKPVAIGMAFGIMLAAALIVVNQSGVWGSSLANLWRLSSLPLLFAGIMVIGFVHEFGHALTLRYFGGSVREMGFLLLYFQPCFYCNLSDAYLLKERRAKMLVGLAGLFFQGVITAVFILLWRLMTPGTIVANFLYVATAFSLAVYLFNFNPLIRLDGYYILADWLRIPNLRARAFAYWRRLVAEWTTGRQSVSAPPGWRHRRIFLIYGTLASVYTIVLLGGLLYYATGFVHSHWGAAGSTILFAGVLLMAIKTRKEMSETTENTAASDAPATPISRRWTKPLIFWGGLVVLGIALTLIKAERNVGSVCRVEPSARFTVSSSSSGTLETELMESHGQQRRERSILLAVSADFSAVKYALRVAEKDSVHVGDTILILASNLVQANLEQKRSERESAIAERNLLLSDPKRDQVLQLRAEMDEITAQRENKIIERDRAKRLLERGAIAQEQYDAVETQVKVLDAQLSAKSSELDLLISGPKAEELAIKEAEIAGLDASIEFLRSQIDASVVLTPIDGIINQINRSNVLVEVAEIDPVRVDLDVGEEDIADVDIRNEVVLKVRSYPFERFEGHVTRIAIDADTLGGTPHFKVHTEIANPGHILKPGMTGYAKIACGKRSVLALMFRRFVQFVRVEFWSWW
jgi:hypothetical protein